MLLLTHASSLAHDTGPGHPERIARARAVAAALAHPDFAGLIREEAPAATRSSSALPIRNAISTASSARSLQRTTSSASTPIR